MEDPKERLTTGISTAELERRWKAVREMMRGNKIDFLVMQNSEDFLGGYMRWFTDFPAEHQFPFTVIFPVDDEMTTITCGGNPPSPQFPPEWAARGVKNRLGAPYFPSIPYTNTYDAELAVGVLKERKRATIGLVGRAFIPVTFYEHLIKHLPDAKFVDATDQVDEIKVPKSLEEIELIRRTAELQDRAIEHVKRNIRPGMKDYEVFAQAQFSTVTSGSERQLILCSSGPQGSPVPPGYRRFQNRVIKEGDHVYLLLETNGPGGYYTEISRIFSVGRLLEIDETSIILHPIPAGSISGSRFHVFQLLAGSFQSFFTNQSTAQSVFSLQQKRIVIRFRSNDVYLPGYLILKPIPYFCHSNKSFLDIPGDYEGLTSNISRRNRGLPVLPFCQDQHGRA